MTIIEISMQETNLTLVYEFLILVFFKFFRLFIYLSIHLFIYINYLFTYIILFCLGFLFFFYFWGVSLLHHQCLLLLSKQKSP